jgi:MFS family permease
MGVPPPQPWTLTTRLIVIIAVIGFAFDTYELLVMPLINRPALAELLGVDRLTEAGAREIRNWSGYITWSSAACGGVFGLLGGWLTDRFGRRTILTWSILLFAFSALASGFSTSALMLLILRCMTFIGVCVEFVAAVAWLAELFPNPKQRERVLGYTQAFSSIGGLMATGSYLLINECVTSLPSLGYGEENTWRYTLISGVIPALPLIFIRPFLPESPAWMQKRAAGTLGRANLQDLFRSLGELFTPTYFRVSIVTALLFACGFAAAFGALQLTPQMTPGLFPAIGREAAGARARYEAALAAGKEGGLQLAELKQRVEELAKKAEASPGDDALKAEAARAAKVLQTAAAASQDPAKMADLKKKAAEGSDADKADAAEALAAAQSNPNLGKVIARVNLTAKAAKEKPDDETAQKDAETAKKGLGLVLAAAKDPEKLKLLNARVAEVSKTMEGEVAGVQMYQEIGGLVGRFALAFLATVIVSRRLLLWTFQLPGLVLIPLVYFFPAAGFLPADYNVPLLKAGIFVAGFLTIAQFSYWGNYLPRVYPTHLRGTGESFAANIGGRLIGTSGQFLAANLLAPFFVLAIWPSLGQFSGLAVASGIVALLVYALGSFLTIFLPQPKEEVAQE